MTSRAADITHAELADLVGRDAKLILEIGANDGEDTLRLLESFPQATILAFECDPRPIKKWREQVTDTRATLFEFAVSDRLGKEIFHQSSGVAGDSQDWDKSGSLCKPTGHLVHDERIKFYTQIEVWTVPLDQHYPPMSVDWPEIDLMWIDVQSAERRALSGAEKTLEKVRFIKAECHRQQLYEGQWQEHEMMAWMDARGFECLGRYADDLLFSRR